MSGLWPIRGFRKGDRIKHARGWIGEVTGEPSDSGLIWCRFDEIGQFGADPKLLSHVRRLPS